MRIRYRSWVPTVAGRLSFTAIGNSSFPSAVDVVNVVNDGFQFIGLSQKREKLDIPFFKGFLSKLLKLDGNFVFVMLARTRAGGEGSRDFLTGRIFLFSIHAWRNLGARDRYKILVDYAEAAVLRSDISGCAALSRQATSYLGELCLIQFSFVLNRCGELGVVYDSCSRVTAEAPRWKSAGNFREQLHVVASQAFFFIKDVSHTHQHHDAFTDTMVDLHTALPRDHKSWRNLVLFGLYRKIIQYKKIKDHNMLLSSLGVLAYAKSFRRICESRGLTVANFHDEEILHSIRAVEKEVGGRALKSVSRSRFMIAVSITFLAASASLVSVLSVTEYRIKDVEVNTIIKFAADLIIKETPAFLSVSIIVLGGVYAFTEGREKIITSRLAKNIVSVLNYFPRRKVLRAGWLVSLVVFFSSMLVILYYV